jgi:rare lipoprotein A (peptidoglycan hydrolase)
MRIDAKTALAMLALTAGLLPLSGAQQALASAGGASAPAAPSASTTHAAKVRPSGIATWFGPGFYGKQTACGQILTPHVVGVANRTLPCGTLVKVVYKSHSLTIPVLDRGPYAHGADWDLTSGAAQALGISDTVRIATRIVGRTANVPSLGAPLTPPTESLAGGAAAA